MSSHPFLFCTGETERMAEQNVLNIDTGKQADKLIFIFIAFFMDDYITVLGQAYLRGINSRNALMCTSRRCY